MKTKSVLIAMGKNQVAVISKEDPADIPDEFTVLRFHSAKEFFKSECFDVDALIVDVRTNSEKTVTEVVKQLYKIDATFPVLLLIQDRKENKSISGAERVLVSGRSSLKDVLEKTRPIFKFSTREMCDLLLLNDSITR